MTWGSTAIADRHMQRPTISQIALAAGIVLVGWVFHVSRGWSGEATPRHVLGGILLLVSAGLSLLPSIPFYLGVRKAGALTGWRKALVVLPIGALSLLLLAS